MKSKLETVRNRLRSVKLVGFEQTQSAAPASKLGTAKIGEIVKNKLVKPAAE